MSEIKQKTIFDILNDLTFNKVSWKDQDQKKVQTWMLNRWFSMHLDYLDLIAECQPLTDTMTTEQWYKFYLDLFPKQKFFTKYIKSKSEKEDSKVKLIEFLSSKLETSQNEMEEYIELLIPFYTNEVKEFIKRYGYDDKRIAKEFKL